LELWLGLGTGAVTGAGAGVRDRVGVAPGIVAGAGATPLRRLHSAKFPTDTGNNMGWKRKLVQKMCEEFPSLPYFLYTQWNFYVCLVRSIV